MRGRVSLAVLILLLAVLPAPAATEGEQKTSIMEINFCYRAVIPTVFANSAKKGFKGLWPIYHRYLNNPMGIPPDKLETQVVVPIVPLELK